MSHSNVLTTGAERHTRRSDCDDALASMMSVCGAAINGMGPLVTCSQGWEWTLQFANG